MQILGSAPVSLTAHPGVMDSPILPVALPFSPVRLVCLVTWVYLCVYFVQIIQFSPLVPKRYKELAYMVTLFAGPLLLLVLMVVDTVRKSSVGGRNFTEVLKEQLTGILANVRPAAKEQAQKDSQLRLLDTSGRSIDEIYGHGRSKRQASQILCLTQEIISEGLSRRASDILIDPKDEANYAIRLRIDGVLRIVREMPAETAKAVINSIKAVSSMDIAERRRPQDGAFIAKKGDMTASFRVASAGAVHGEKLSVRILNQDAGGFRLAGVGFTKKQCQIIQEALAKPAGMILMCGPTGSGKTTTLYAMLNEIDRTTHNVITVEDPIEAVLPCTSQLEVNPKADITFANVLRSILRQDPDVICVGEIRDEETAQIALRAAQTGHLVLATIHCDSNAAALIRLLDLNVSPLLMASGLNLLVSQRLVRRLCQRCKKPAQLTPPLKEECQKKGIECSNIYQATGCKHCDGTGYFGRTAICDPLVVTDPMRADIAENQAYLADLKSKGDKQGKVNLRKEGLRKVAVGIISLEELKRVVG